MFTGIIQHIGKLEEKRMSSSAIELVITLQEEIDDLKKGESIALDGICLTVEEFTKISYTCYVSPTTAECTNISTLERGNSVNLERALRPIDRMGGHFVTGHVDTVATLINKKDRDGSLFLSFLVKEEYSPYILNKGSITINGISLTVASFYNNIVEITVIPETQKQTTIASWHEKQRVNIETDILGKYIVNTLRKQENPTALTKDILFKNGFL